MNRILSEPHGKKYAVIVNEFGEIGIDNELVVNADEEVFEMNNGCICCTVRGDLVRIIDGLMRRKGKFDAIIVETTGLADPAPVAQTFFMDEAVGAKTKLDAVVTVADAKWLKDRLKDAPEAKNQIAFADVILINKTDLVSPGDLDEIEARIRAINPYAKVHRTERASIALDEVLGRNAFDLDRILDIEPAFLTAEEEHVHEHDHDHDHDHGHEHHHHGNGLKHYHDEDMQSVALRTDKPLEPGQVLPLGAGSGGDRGQEHPALQGHPVVQGRPRAFRVPGRAHDPRRRPPARLEGRTRSAKAAPSSSAAICRKRKSAQGLRAVLRNLIGSRALNRPRCVRSPRQRASRSIEAAPSASMTRRFATLLRMRAERKHMTDTQPPIPSLADRVRPVEAGAPVVGVHFFGGTPVFVLGEEALLFAPEDGERRVAMHGGGILASASDGTRIVTGGDDGKLVATDADGEPSGHRHRRQAPLDRPGRARPRWRRRLVGRQDRACAHQEGRAAQLRGAVDGGGLAFAPKGFRLAIAHYNGATLWFPNAAGATPQMLEWKGSHLGVTFSPDGKFLVTAMQESALHGWRIVDGKHMRMSGYSARVRSLGWTAGGAFLATSGSEQLILWPFDGKDGPMGGSRRCWRRRRRASPSSPAIRASRWWRRAMPTARCCWCASTTAP